MDKCNWIIKSLVAFICLVLFFVNNYVLFMQFAERQTVTTTKIVYTKTETLPNIIICSSTSFKNPQMSSIDMKSYLNNTFKLEDSLISIDLGNEDHEIGSSNGDAVLFNSTYISKDVYLEPILTYYRGTCYMFKYNIPVM